MNETWEMDAEDFNKKSFDNFFIGLAVAVILTVLTLYTVADGFSSDLDFMGVLQQAHADFYFHKMMILSNMPNMFLFFFFYKTERWQSAKGLIVAVLLSMVTIAL